MDISVVTPVRDDPLIGQAITSVPAGIDHVVAFTQPSDRVRTIVEAHRAKSGLRLVETSAVIFHQALTFRIDVPAHLGYGRSMAYIDQRRGGRYGLGICTLRLYPSTLANKLVYRGLESVFRSLLLGTVMLYGYADQSW